ncbi:hypothetical protein [Geobacillus phage GR1]|nr:hypothetical protein [Geobacillus phage GR1]
MKPLLSQKEEKIVTTSVSQDALNDIAIKLLKGNYKTIELVITRDFYEEESEATLLVGDGYEVTIKQTVAGGMI